MPNIRRPNVPPMPDRPVSPMPRMPGGGDMPYPPNVDYRPVKKMPGRGNPPMVQPPPDIGMKPPFSSGGGGALMPGAPDVPSASLPVGAVYKKGGKVSASKRADGIAQRGKTKGKIC